MFFRIAQHFLQVKSTVYFDWTNVLNIVGNHPSGRSRRTIQETLKYLWTHRPKKFFVRIPSLKTTPWKRRFLLESIIFRCYVSFRECNSEKDSAFGSIHCLKTFNLHPKDSHRNSRTPMNSWQFGRLRPFSSAVRYCQWFAQDGKTNCLRRCRSFGQNGEVILLVWLAVARHTFSKTQVRVFWLITWYVWYVRKFDNCWKAVLSEELQLYFMMRVLLHILGVQSMAFQAPKKREDDTEEMQQRSEFYIAHVSLGKFVYWFGIMFCSKTRWKTPGKRPGSM